ncbi:MAG: molybdate ABC transporter substrate-binding protein [Planctomycetes bacterium]|nr:molybdate ABC transporter substrate-binding protein [Planctomycetota bacterium]
MPSPLLRRLSLTTLTLLLTLPGACTKPTPAAEKTMVFAAASLTAAFEELAKTFEQGHPGARLELHFAGTPQLVLQLQEGAEVDVFAAADQANMQKVVATGKTTAAPVTFAQNRLTIVVAKGNPKGIAGLADLSRQDLRVVLCGPEVPAGRYARQALDQAKVAVASRSDEPSVKAVVSKVALGEVDAGIVYVTDAAGAKDKVDAVAIADEQNVIASYPIVRLQCGHAEDPVGEQFVAFVLSAAGQAVLARHGFAAP